MGPAIKTLICAAMCSVRPTLWGGLGGRSPPRKSRLSSLLPVPGQYISSNSLKGATQAVLLLLLALESVAGAMLLGLLALESIARVLLPDPPVLTRAAQVLLPSLHDARRWGRRCCAL